MLAAKDARALAAQTDKKKNDTSGDNRKGHVKVLSAKKMQKKKRKKKAHKTGPKLSKKANEESFVEQVRNMWRSAVLETVGLGTDAAFLKRIGIEEDENEKDASLPGEAACQSQTTSGLSHPKKRITSIDASSSSTKPLGDVRPSNPVRSNPPVFTSQPDKFPCKRCGEFIAVNDIITHATHCGDSWRAAEAIDHAVESRSFISSSTDGHSKDPSASDDYDSNGFVCQLCNLRVLDTDMATHPATCPGLNPLGAGMFWGGPSTAVDPVT